MILPRLLAQLSHVTCRVACRIRSAIARDAARVPVLSRSVYGMVSLRAETRVLGDAGARVYDLCFSRNLFRVAFAERARARPASSHARHAPASAARRDAPDRMWGMDGAWALGRWARRCARSYRRLRRRGGCLRRQGVQVGLVSLLSTVTLVVNNETLTPEICPPGPVD